MTNKRVKLAYIANPGTIITNDLQMSKEEKK